MRPLPPCQDYEPEWCRENVELRVIAVEPAGSRDAAIRQLIRTDPELGKGLATLRRARPDVAGVLEQLVDELDGLAYRHPRRGLLPLAREPLWHYLVSIRSLATDGDAIPDLTAWLTRLGADADYWWGGLTVITDQGFWQLGDHRPVRERLADAAQCHIARRSPSVDVISLILDRLAPGAAEAHQSRMTIGPAG